MVIAETNQGSVERDALVTIGGVSHRLVQKAHGTSFSGLWALGSNQSNQLGTGTLSDFGNPVLIGSDLADATVGSYYSLFLRHDGSLWGIGANESGQLGDGTTTGKAKPIQIASSVRSMCAGYTTTFFIKEDGSLWGCGNGADGQFGDGLVGNRLVASKVADGVNAVAVGFRFVCFLMNDGSLWAAGNNDYGQLGDGSNTQRVDRVKVADGVIAVSAGAYHTLFIKSDNSLWAVGRNNSGQLGDGTGVSRNIPVKIDDGVVSISAGVLHSIYAKSDGSVWTMGSDTQGQLGSSYAYSSKNVSPLKIATDGKTVAAGFYTSFYITNDGRGYGCGQNTSGEVGRSSSMQFLEGLASMGRNLRGIRPGAHHTLLLSTADIQPFGVVLQPKGQEVSEGANVSFNVIVGGETAPTYQWYHNDVAIEGATNPSLVLNSVKYEQNGRYMVVVTDGATSVTSQKAVLVINAAPVITLQPFDTTEVVGSSITLRAYATGTPAPSYQWRKNGVSLGEASSTNSLVLNNISSSDAGDYDVIISNTWGAVTSRTARVTVPALQLIPDSKIAGAAKTLYSIKVHSNSSWDATSSAAWISISPGRVEPNAYLEITLAPNEGTSSRFGEVVVGGVVHKIEQKSPLAGGLDLWAMGSNSSGQFTDGTDHGQNYPLQIASGVTTVAAGFQYGLRLMDGGVLWGAGDTQGDQFGTRTNSNIEPLNLASNVRAIAAGGRHILYIKSDGSLWGRGSTSCGQLGYISDEPAHEPVQIATDVIAVCSRSYTTFFIKKDATLWGCGSNESSQLGAGAERYVGTPILLASDVLSVATGLNHVLFIKTDGSLWGAGGNSYGQLGDGTTENRGTPIKISENIASVSAGASHSLFITKEGRLFSMGYNGYGQLGDGSTLTRKTPVFVADGVSASAAGNVHSAFIKLDGSLWSMGWNDSGQLGDSTKENQPVPKKVANNVVFVSAAYEHTMFLARGSAEALRISVQPKATSVSVGGTATLSVVAVGAEGATYQWYRNGLAIPGATASTFTIQKSLIEDAASYMVIITKGGDVLKSNAVVLTVLCPPELFSQPMGVTRLAGDQAVLAFGVYGVPSPSIVWRKDGKIIPGATYRILEINNLSITNAGSYDAVISNSSGSITTDPVSIAVVDRYLSPSSRVVGPHRLLYPVRIECSGSWEAKTDASWVTLHSASSGTDSSMVELEVAPNVSNEDREATITIGGLVHKLTQRAAGVVVRELWATGCGGGYAMGDGSNADRVEPISTLDNVLSVSYGEGNGLALKEDGTLWGFGSRPAAWLYGTSSSVPVQIASDIACMATSEGSHHSLYLKKNGVLWAAGHNLSGQLGNETTTDSTIPVRVMADVKAVAVGDSHSLILKKDGTLWAFGDNFYGQLGDGTNTSRKSPVKIDSEVAAIAAQTHQSFYIKNDGSLWAMGCNSGGVLGFYSQSYQFTPVRVADNVVSVVPGAAHTLFIKKDGGLWGMGHNGTNALQDISDVCLYTPVQIATGVLAAGAGIDYSMYILSDGSLWAVGHNQYGQFGNGTFVSSGSPVKVANNVSDVFAEAKNSFFITTGAREVFRISEQPVGGSVAVGGSLTLRVAVSSSSSPTYQWFKDGQPVPGAQAPALQLSSVTSASAGSYTVVVTDNGVSLTSSAVTVSIVSPPQIIIQPQDTVASLASPVTLYVYAEGTPIISYQWRKDGVVIDRKTDSKLDLWPVSASSEGTYDVVLSNSCGQVVSTSATVHVLPTVVTPLEKTIGASGGKYSVIVTSSSAWDISCNAAWVSVSKPSSGTVVTVYVAANASGADRSATVLIGGAAHVLTQRADSMPLLELWRFCEDEILSGPQGINASSVQIATGVKQAAICSNCTYQIMEDGSLYSVGYSCCGMLGDGTTRSRDTVLKVASGVECVKVHPKGQHALFLKADGSLWGMGSNFYHQLGADKRDDILVPWLIASDVVDFSAGYNHSLFIKKDNSLWGAGANESGQIGRGASIANSISSMICSDVKAVSAGESHSAFIKVDGTLWTLGGNDYGQLGDGTLTQRRTPVRVASDVRSVSCGSNTTFFVKIDGSLWGMGANTYGQLGDGTTQKRSIPVKIAENVGSVDGGDSITLFLKSDGVLWGMGNDRYGIIGGSSSDQFLLPALIARNVIAFDAGMGTSLFLTRGAHAQDGQPPSLTANLESKTTVSGDSVTFKATAEGTGPLSYQWYKDGIALSGQNSSSLLLSGVALSDEGSYTVVVTNRYGSVTSKVATLSVETSRITAVSVRAQAGSDENTLILGVLLKGAGTKPMILRALGPNLSEAVSNYMSDPKLVVYGAEKVKCFENDNWQDSEELRTRFASIGMGPLPTGSHDAATVQVLSENLYTMHVNSMTGENGIVLAEIYDSMPNQLDRNLRAVSVRNFVGAGDKLLIAGVIISGPAPKKLLIRGLGPCLAASVNNSLVDPMIRIHRVPSGELIAENDNWAQDSAVVDCMARLGFDPLPVGSLDAAMVLTVPPGAYTVSLVGKNDSTGVGMIEVYEVE
jgi:alpha-tubulin suppressor-like RCC1 family protein